MKGRARSPSRRFCCVGPSPEVYAQIKEEVTHLTTMGGTVVDLIASGFGLPRRPRPFGFDDGTCYPEPPASMAVHGVAERTIGPPQPVDGTVRALVLLVDFADNQMATAADHYRQMLFSEGAFSTGSMRDYYAEVSYGKVIFQGDVLGPIRAPQAYSYYTNNQSGTGGYPRNTPRLVEDVVALAAPQVDFSQYDRNGDGYVDALFIVHAGPGAEAIRDAQARKRAIWSHKWVTSRELSYNGVKVYAYFTAPEDGQVGVFAHEAGHLVFGWPDLYDIDYSSNGLGNWCLMAGGSWNNGGRTPAHPSAWCKAVHGWCEVVVPVVNGRVNLPAVETTPRIHKVWTEGRPHREYFLLENRQRTGFDRYLPGEGLLIFHVDENQANNGDERHYAVGLEQADGLSELESAAPDRGDDGDPYPGSSANRAFTDASRPSSRDYGGNPTRVAVTNISDSGPLMAADVAVTTAAPVDLESEIRKAVWARQGVPYDPDAAFARRAAQESLGPPFSGEFDVEIAGRSYRIQLFGRGWVWAPVGEWDKARTSG